MQQRWIGLLDCNNFFVSCERLFRPELRTVPVAVLSSNDGCIVARSQEIKDMQIPMGVPYFQVKDSLKDKGAVLFSGNHTLYRDLSRRVMDILRQEIESVEQYSIDEAFLRMEGDAAAVRARAQEVKDTIERSVGIPVSVGVSTSKTLAKVANATAKRGSGVSVLDKGEWETRGGSLELEQVWGIGPGLARRMRAQGLYTVADYVAVDPARIRQLFGVVGERIYLELQGIPAIETTHKPKQSLMSSRSFASETNDEAVLREALAYHVEKVAYELRHMNHAAQYLSVFIAPSRHGDFVLHNRAGTHEFTVPEERTSELTRAAHQLLRQLFERDVPYKKAGVRLGGLVPAAARQGDLFTAESEQAATPDPLQVALDALARKYQTGQVHLGRLERAAVYHGKALQQSPAYTTSWRQIKNVKA